MAIKKILLINPRVDVRPFPPLGLAYIAATAEKKGYEVKIYDPIAGYDAAAFASLLETFSPDIIGITCLTPQEEKLYFYADEAKKLRPGTPVAAGGVHPTIAPERVLSRPSIDLIVIGEGERVFISLLEALDSGVPLSSVKGVGFKEAGRQVINPQAELIEDLDSVPWPARHLLDMRWYSRRLSLIRGKWLRCATVIAIRGCPYECIFCSSNKIFGRKVRYRSPADIIKEVKRLVDSYGLEGVFFVDDTFTLSKKWVLEVCRLLREEVPGLLWACQSKVGTLDDEIIQAMIGAGCIQIEFGIESGSQKVLAALNKKQTVDEIRRTFQLCGKYPLRTMANFIVGNPEEKAEDIDLTAALAREIAADYTEFFILTPYPGTKIYELAVKNGWLVEGDAFYGRESRRPIMSINFSPDELVALRKKLYENTLNSIWKSYLLDPRFLSDVTVFFFKHPLAVFECFGVLWKEKSLAEAGRHLNNLISQDY